MLPDDEARLLRTLREWEQRRLFTASLVAETILGVVGTADVMIVPLEQMVDSVRVALRTAGVWTRKARPDFIHLLSAAEVGAGLRELARQAEEGPGYSNAWAMRLTEALIRTQVLPALGELAGGIGPEAFGFGVPREEGF